MAFNFGEVIARAGSDVMNQQAQNRMSMMQMVQAQQAQREQNLMRMEEMRQRKLELDLNSRIQTFREQQDVRKQAYDDAMLSLQERLAKAQEALNPYRQKEIEAATAENLAQAALYDEQKRAWARGGRDNRQPGSSATGGANAAARTADLEIETNEKEIERLTEEASALDIELAQKERARKGLFGEDEMSLDEYGLVERRAGLQSKIDSLRNANLRIPAQTRTQIQQNMPGARTAPTRTPAPAAADTTKPKKKLDQLLD